MSRAFALLKSMNVVRLCIRALSGVNKGMIFFGNALQFLSPATHVEDTEVAFEQDLGATPALEQGNRPFDSIIERWSPSDKQ